jgi:hypothetical protein
MALRGTAVGAAVGLAWVSTAFGQATERSEAKVEGCVIKPLSESKPEWQRTADSLSQLIGTGQYEIRAAYRFKACDNEFTIYVLQNITDRSAVFECSSDDTYRPVFPCFKVGTGDN